MSSDIWAQLNARQASRWRWALLCSLLFNLLLWRAFLPLLSERSAMKPTSQRIEITRVVIGARGSRVEKMAAPKPRASFLKPNVAHHQSAPPDTSEQNAPSPQRFSSAPNSRLPHAERRNLAHARNRARNVLRREVAQKSEPSQKTSFSIRSQILTSNAAAPKRSREISNAENHAKSASNSSVIQGARDGSSSSQGTSPVQKGDISSASGGDGQSGTPKSNFNNDKTSAQPQNLEPSIAAPVIPHLTPPSPKVTPTLTPKPTSTPRPTLEATPEKTSRQPRGETRRARATHRVLRAEMPDYLREEDFKTSMQASVVVHANGSFDVSVAARGSCGNSSVDRWALGVLRLWKWSPALRDSQPEESDPITITYSFQR